MWETFKNIAMISFLLIWVIGFCLFVYGSILNSLSEAGRVRDHADIFTESEIAAMVLIALSFQGGYLIERWHRRGLFRKKQRWHHVLGVDHDASLEDIKAAHRKLSKLYHPDSAPDGIGDEERFQAVTNAYKIAKFVAENRPKKNSGEKFAH